jgi:hypothetical protein
MPSLDDVLEHHGIKGMKWGARTKDSGNPEVQVFRTTKRSPTKIKTRKGGNLPASEDAVNAAVFKQVAKKSGPNALTNNELQALVTRMNLERQFSTLNPTPSKAAKKFIADFLLGIGKQQAGKFANDLVAKKLTKILTGK